MFDKLHFPYLLPMPFHPTVTIGINFQLFFVKFCQLLFFDTYSQSNSVTDADKKSNDKLKIVFIRKNVQQFFNIRTV